MSANTYWEPVKREARKSLSVMAPSHFNAVMTEVFGSPWELTGSDIPRLLAMAAVWRDQEHNPFRDMADALATHEEILVWQD